MTSFTKLGAINYSVMDENQADDFGCSSQTIPPATKRAKRASKWKEEWTGMCHQLKPAKGDELQGETAGIWRGCFHAGRWSGTTARVGICNN